MPCVHYCRIVQERAQEITVVTKPGDKNEGRQDGAGSTNSQQPPTRSFARVGQVKAAATRTAGAGAAATLNRGKESRAPTRSLATENPYRLMGGPREPPAIASLADVSPALH